MLLNYHICRFVLSSLRVGDLVRTGLSSARVAGFRALLKPSRTKSPTQNELRTKQNNNARSNKRKM